MTRKHYDKAFKYKIIEEICNGKSYRDIGREYPIARSTAMNWMITFIKKGTFDDIELPDKENLWLEKLKEKAKKENLS